MNIIKSTIAAAVLAFGGVAQAIPYYLDTLDNWATAGTQVDADGDAQWTLESYDASLGSATITMSELDVAGVDYYTMDFSFNTLAAGGIENASYTLTYLGEQLSDQVFASAHLDSTHAGLGTLVTKKIYDADTNALLKTLTSIDGVSSDGLYTGTKNIRVVETYSAGSNGILTSSENTFDVIPEPLTPALLGLGMIGLGWMRRRQLG